MQGGNSIRGELRDQSDEWYRNMRLVAPAVQSKHLHRLWRVYGDGGLR
jgi:hypothetical protein